MEKINNSFYKKYKKNYQKYYEKNKNKIIENQKLYNKNNKDKLKEYYQNNKDKLKEYQNNYYRITKRKIKLKTTISQALYHPVFRVTFS